MNSDQNNFEQTGADQDAGDTLQALMAGLKGALEKAADQQNKEEESALREALGQSPATEMDLVIEKINRRRRRFLSGQTVTVRRLLDDLTEDKTPYSLEELADKEAELRAAYAKEKAALESDKEKEFKKAFREAAKIPGEAPQKDRAARKDFAEESASMDSEIEQAFVLAFSSAHKVSAFALVEALSTLKEATPLSVIQKQENILREHLSKSGLLMTKVLEKSVNRAVAKAKDESAEAYLATLSAGDIPASGAEIEETAAYARALWENEDGEMALSSRKKVEGAVRKAYDRLALARLADFQAFDGAADDTHIEERAEEVQNLFTKTDRLLRIQSQQPLIDAAQAAHRQSVEKKIVRLETSAAIWDAGAIEEAVASLKAHYKGSSPDDVVARSFRLDGAWSEELSLRVDVACLMLHGLAVDGKIAKLKSSEKTYSAKTIRRLRREICAHAVKANLSLDAAMKKRIKEAARDAHGFSAYAKIEKLASTNHAYSDAALARCESEIRHHFKAAKIKPDEKDAQCLLEALAHAQQVSATAFRRKEKKVVKKDPQKMRVEAVNRMVRHEVCRRLGKGQEPLTPDAIQSIRADMDEAYTRRQLNVLEEKQKRVAQKEMEAEAARARAEKMAELRAERVQALHELGKSKQESLQEAVLPVQVIEEEFKVKRRKILGRDNRETTTARAGKGASRMLETLKL